jgi:hypothetical protein
MVPANNSVPMPVTGDDSGDMLFDARAFRHAMELAKTISESALIPPHLRGKVPDILLALYMARTMGENPLYVLQSIHVIQGRAAWSAQYLIARANGSGRFRGPIRWREEGQGDSLAVTAYATLAETGDDVEYTVDMKMAKAEGWTNRNPKYRTMPNLMLRYRSATLLVRLFVPDVLMGLHERYELIDSGRDRGPVNQQRVAALPEPEPTIAEIPVALEVPLERAPVVRPKARVEPPPAQDRQEPQEAPESPQAPVTPVPDEPVAVVAEPAVAEPVVAEPVVAEGAPAEPAADEDRPAVLAKLAKLREEHPDIVRQEARKLGLRSPAKSDVIRLRELINAVEARVQAAIAELSVQVEDPEELMIIIADARAAVEEGLGPEAVLEAAQAAGLPIGPEGPVLDGAPDPMLLRYLEELRDRRRIWAPPVRVLPTE